MKTTKKSKKAPAKHVIFKRPFGEHFHLLREFLQQRLMGIGYAFRQTPRAELKNFFARVDLRQYENGVRGEYGPGGASLNNMWTAKYYPASKTEKAFMKIGCQRFTPQETVKLRKWAMGAK